MEKADAGTFGNSERLGGSKGAGKSTLLFSLMATVSTGGVFPDGSRCDEPGDVLVWSGEDDWEDTILPRFIASGGDRNRIYRPGTVDTGTGRRPFDPSIDMPALLTAARNIPDLKLVGIDPVVMAVGDRRDSHKNAEVRRGLQPLVDFSGQRNAALLGITHFTKGTDGKDPMERLSGSLAFGALPRVVLGASADEDGSQRRLVRIGSNIGPSGGGVEYRLVQTMVTEDGEAIPTQRAVWGARLQGTARELLGSEIQSAIGEAETFLRTLLAEGGMTQKAVREAADNSCHSWATRSRNSPSSRPRWERRMNGAFQR
jgi:hypothetical protein